MEKNIKSLPSFDELLKFWKVIRPLKKNEYVEIRFTDSEKPGQYYKLMKQFIKDNPTIYSTNFVQLYIQTFSQLTLLLSAFDYYFFKNFKICYGLNLRIKNKEGILGGSYEFINEVRFVFVDIDKTDHSNLTEFDQKILDTFLYETVLPFLKKYNLSKAIIVHSGGGRHCLFKIPNQKITEAKRRWFRTFIKSISNRLSNTFFELDPIFDMTRVFALPETRNVKRKVKTKLIECTEEINNFKLRSERKKKPKIKIQFSKNILPQLKNSLEWYILCHPNVPQGEVHRTVLFSIKLLLKELEIKDYQELEDEMNDVRGSHHNLDPYYGTEGKEYSPYIIVNWCKRHDAWCKQNNIVYEGYAEKILQRLQKNQ